MIGPRVNRTNVSLPRGANAKNSADVNSRELPLVLCQISLENGDVLRKCERTSNEVESARIGQQLDSRPERW